jgi:hypothetical protein
MGAENKSLIFLVQVSEATLAGKLKWQETADEGSFLAAMGGKYTVKMFPYEDDFRVIRDPSLTLYEGNDILLDITKKSLGVSLEHLNNLYEVVARQVYRVDEKNKSIDDAIDLLKNL